MIEICKFESINKGSLIAKFNIKMHKWGGFLIKECCLIETNGQRWINFPSRPFEIEGKKKYAPYIGYEEPSLNEKFKELIMKELKEFIEKNNASREEAFSELQPGEIPF